MKIALGRTNDDGDIRPVARDGEALGYDTLLTAEMRHDPFIQAARMIDQTSRVEVMTGIAVAFSRTPMLLAQLAHDLNAISKGRFIMGLGSQVRPHIIRRFSMPWSHPAPRMKEMIRAIHAIWDCWYDGKPLNFEGQFYTHTLMTPYFTPTDTESGRAKIHLAAVGEKMTEVAGEVADGMICHAFTTERYIRTVTMPVIDAALARSGRKRTDFEITYTPFVACAETEEKLEAGLKEVRGQIAFYGSTPAYRGVLDLHGWGALHEELHRLSKQGRWEEMGALIDKDVLAAFAVVGTPDEVATELKRRFGDFVDRIAVFFNVDPALRPKLIAGLKAKA